MKAKSKESMFLKGFTKIKLTTICRKYGYDVANIQNDRCKHEYIEIVFRDVLKELVDLYNNTFLSGVDENCHQEK